MMAEPFPGNTLCSFSHPHLVKRPYFHSVTSKDSRVRKVKILSKTTESHTLPSAVHCLTQLSDTLSQAWAPVSPAPGDYFTAFPIPSCIFIKETINGPFWPSN